LPTAAPNVPARAHKRQLRIAGGATKSVPLDLWARRCPSLLMLRPNAREDSCLYWHAVAVGGSAALSPRSPKAAPAGRGGGVRRRRIVAPRL